MKILNASVLLALLSVGGNLMIAGNALARSSDGEGTFEVTTEVAPEFVYGDAATEDSAADQDELQAPEGSNTDSWPALLITAEDIDQVIRSVE